MDNGQPTIAHSIRPSQLQTINQASKAKVELNAIQKRWETRRVNHARGLCGCIFAEQCAIRETEAKGRSEGLCEAVAFLVGAGL